MCHSFSSLFVIPWFSLTSSANNLKWTFCEFIDDKWDSKNQEKALEVEMITKYLFTVNHVVIVRGKHCMR